MNGPKHYREAERLLNGIASIVDTGTGVAVRSRGHALVAEVALSMAQVHATLALTAATVDAVTINGQQAYATEWWEATS